MQKISFVWWNLLNLNVVKFCLIDALLYSIAYITAGTKVEYTSYFEFTKDNSNPAQRVKYEM